MDVVLKHLRNITAHSGDTSDRWNSHNYPMIQTFGFIFSYISERWRDVNISVQGSLRTSSIIPIGHQLAKPSRVFFRLSEDLSPFMHEIPRVFGAQEKFLKEIGVRERPSPQDYVHFLGELALECSSEALNPNELKAVLAIIQSIVSQTDQDVDNKPLVVSSPNRGGSLFVPDEDGILRDSKYVVYTDSAWLRAKIDLSLINSTVSLHILHPLISKADAQKLSISSLSTVLIESLSSSFVPRGISNEKNVLQPYLDVLYSLEFAQALFLVDSRMSTVSLLGNAIIGSSMLSGDPRVTLELCVVIRIIGVRFLDDLRIKIAVFDTNNIKKSITVQEDLSTLCFVNRTGSATNKFIQSMLAVLHHQESSVLSTKTSNKALDDEIIYVNYSAASTATSIINPCLAIALGLCSIFQIDSIAASLLANILQTGVQYGISEMMQVLLDLRINSDIATNREKSRAIPGVTVLPADYEMLELKPFRSFQPGEVVAIDRKGDGVASRQYATVLTVGDVSETGLRMISLRTGDGTESFSSTDVFSFRSARSAATNNSSAEKKTNGTPGPIMRTEFQKSIIENKANDKIIQTNEVRQESTIDTKMKQKVDVMNALSGLLSRAGIPLSMENEVLVLIHY